MSGTLKFVLSIILVLLLGTSIYILTLGNLSVDKTTYHNLLSHFDDAHKKISEVHLDSLNIAVRKLMADKCFRCHNSTKHEAALILDTREGIFEGGENGAILISGDSKQSEIVRRISLASRHEDVMPPKGKKLSKQEISLITTWIDFGTHWKDTTLKFFNEAPLALSKPPLPYSEHHEHPVDVWVDQYFAQERIRWPNEIEDYRFVRKAYLDAIGLLPDTSVITEFITDTNPDKHAMLIKGLLSDDHEYAAHWLSFWNDLLRNDYTGTGFITGGRRQITDWLYQSLLDDKPYRLMVQQLINPDSLSEGFIRGIQWRGAVNASQRVELQAAQNISQSFLGLNLKCASCHNSFVNNVSLKQAYDFANVFADSTLEIYQCDKATGRYAGTSFIYPEVGQVSGAGPSERLVSLSEIIVSEKNGKLYRTMVNRIWDRLLGRGLVGTVDDMDRMPWSQPLLDWLASDFIEHETSLKHLIARIMTSKTYRLEAQDYEDPESLSKESFRFLGPVARRVTAEQFVDAFSRILHPFYASTYYRTHGLEGNPQWIWHREIELDRTVLPKPGARWLRRSFSLQNVEDVVSADLLVAGDSAFTIFLNSQKIAENDNWREVQRITLQPAQFKNQNCLAIHGINNGKIPNPAGILLTLRVKYQDDDIRYLTSNKEWITIDTMPSADWTTTTYHDKHWKKAHSSGEKSFWGYMHGFTFDTLPALPPRASFVRLDPFLHTMGRPTRENVTTKRDTEATLLQAMLLTNDKEFNINISSAAKKLDAKTLGTKQKATSLFFQLLSRKPNEGELQVMLDKIDNGHGPEGWEDVIWALLMLPELNVI